MNMKNLLLSLCMIFTLVATIGLVSATVTVQYDVYNATIDDSNNLITSTVNVDDLSARLYDCTDASCSNVGNLVGTFTTTTNQIQIVFPTINATPAYTIYFYKPGYIGWEQANVNIWGDFADTYNDTNPYIAPSSVYLSKLESGYAPIMNLSVDDNVTANTPINIISDISVDADTYSAIEDSRSSDVPLNENVSTLVTLNITNSSGAQIYTENQTVQVPYSGNVQVSFTYAGGIPVEGVYNIGVSTDVIDAKILNSITQQTSSSMTIINASNPIYNNYNYTLLNNLEMTPSNPDAGEDVTFSVDYDTYNNDNGTLTGIDTRLSIELFRDGSSMENFVVYTSDSSGTYPFTRNLTQDASYRLSVTGEPEDGGIPMTQELTFVVGGSTPDNNNNNDNSGGDDDEDDEDEELYLSLLAGTSDSDDTDTIKLSGDTGFQFTIKTFLWILFWLILALIVAILMILFPELWFWILLSALILALIIIGVAKLSWLLWASIIALVIIIVSAFLRYL